MKAKIFNWFKEQIESSHINRLKLSQT